MIEVKGSFIIVKEQIHTGETGILPSCCVGDSVYPNMEPVTFAHDLVEHINGVDAIGSIEDELEALGVVLWIRGLAGDLDQGIHTRYTNVAHDIATLYEYTAYDPDSGRDRTIEKIERPDEPTQVDDDIEFTVNTFNDETPGREEFAEIARAYMELGAVKAKQKYGDWQTAYNVFDEAKKAFEYIKNRVGEFGGFETFEGSKFYATVTDTSFIIEGPLMDALGEIEQGFEELEDD